LDTEQLIRDVVKNVVERLMQEKTAQFIAPGADSGQTPGASGAQQGQTSVNQQAAGMARDDRKVVCGISVRHIHLCQEDLDTLFGKEYALNVLRELYNPGFAARETLTVVGPKLTAIQNVRVLGPLRSKTQVELSKTDCIVLGIDAPVRPSGETSGSSSCVLVGPKGTVYLKEGAIRANRHMHLSVEDARYFGIKDNQVVDVRVGGPKGLTFNNVQVRVASDFKTEFHVDTDDGNAADLVNGSLVEIVDASCVSPLGMQMAEGSMIPPSIPDASFTGEISDPNLLKNICSVASGQTCTKDRAAQESQMQQPQTAGITTKTVITMANIDEYAGKVIEANSDVIISPLVKDEAAKRGIQIKYS
jgi:putative phosphotransacetylase